MKLALELIEKIIKISGNPIIDGIIIAFIGFLSFLVAFGLVGVIFNSIGKYDSKNMSDAHWAIRLMVFLGLTFIFVKMAQFFAWIFKKLFLKMV